MLVTLVIAFVPTLVDLLVHSDCGKLRVLCNTISAIIEAFNALLAFNNGLVD